MYKHLIAALVATSAAAAPAYAAQCGPRETVVGKLSSKYSEKLTVGGLQKLQNAAAVVEVWASTETGTFTVLVTRANGTSCIMAAGTDFFASDIKTVPGTAS